MRSRSIKAAFAAMLFAASAFGQAVTDPFDRPRTYDALHYVVKVRFDRSKRSIDAESSIKLRPLADGLRTLVFDSVGIRYRSVTLAGSGAPLAFKTGASDVTVTLDREYLSSETITINFAYSATPEKGIYFVNELVEDGKQVRSDQIWTQGEPDEARHWFPSFDFPSDKATTEQYITAESDETVIGNGELIDKAQEPDGRVTWHYRMPLPHSVYLSSFVVGKYSKVAGRHKNIPLGYYVYPGMEEFAGRVFPETADMMRTFEDLTKVDFPYNKYDQTIVGAFKFGGMENITATTLADTEVMFANFGFGREIVTDLISHELAHSWFGDLVTCANWAELWLNEGFATFMEAAYLEKKLGRTPYLRKIQQDAGSFLADDAVTRRRHGLYNRRAKEVDKLFDNASVTYNKGGVVLHMLREEIGDEAFWSGVKIYLDRHKFDSVRSSDLRKAMEEASGADLGWFFDQWVYGVGHPVLSVQPVYSVSKRQMKFTVTQMQTAARATPATYRLPLQVQIAAGGKTVNERLLITKRTEVFTIPMAVKPRAITADPDKKLPIVEVRIKPVLAGR
ncbi:MAG: M1 family metallopeptidase [Acidobacteria bacterium]|nr:M1 family metallopeptidase [Acidobacteriota bacterium]MCW5950545.1 M1 family metallopeptidase [Pyrinomonadaceae bacterium]